MYVPPFYMHTKCVSSYISITALVIIYISATFALLFSFTTDTAYIHTSIKKNITAHQLTKENVSFLTRVGG